MAKQKKPMEILVYNLDTKKFAWTKVCVDTTNELRQLYDGNYIVLDDDGFNRTLSDTDIYGIKNDIRKNYVLCRQCYELVRKGKEQEHMQKRQASANCDKCRHVSYIKINDISDRIRTKNGKLVRVVESEVVQKCSYVSYSKKDPVEAKRLHQCGFYKCGMSYQDKSTHPIVQTPDLLQTRATISSLTSSEKWKFANKTSVIINFRLGASNLFVAVNELGIIESFTYHSRTVGSVEFVYSAKTDKFYKTSRKRLIEETSLDFLPESKRERWAEYIINLYKEN